MGSDPNSSGACDAGMVPVPLQESYMGITQTCLLYPSKGVPSTLFKSQGTEHLCAHLHPAVKVGHAPPTYTDCGLFLVQLTSMDFSAIASVQPKYQDCIGLRLPGQPAVDPIVL